MARPQAERYGPADELAALRRESRRLQQCSKALIVEMEQLRRRIAQFSIDATPLDRPNAGRRTSRPNGKRAAVHVGPRPLVLVIDDEPRVREIACRHLHAEGFQCLEAESAGEALVLLGTGLVPDLLVVDVRLPDLDGPALSQQIQAHLPGIPVLFISAWSDAVIKQASLDPLNWTFLAKPYTRTELGGAVRQLLELGTE